MGISVEGLLVLAVTMEERNSLLTILVSSLFTQTILDFYVSMRKMNNRVGQQVAKTVRVLGQELKGRSILSRQSKKSVGSGTLAPGSLLLIYGKPWL